MREGASVLCGAHWAGPNEHAGTLPAAAIHAVQPSTISTLTCVPRPQKLRLLNAADWRDAGQGGCPLLLLLLGDGGGAVVRMDRLLGRSRAAALPRQDQAWNGGAPPCLLPLRRRLPLLRGR